MNQKITVGYRKDIPIVKIDENWYTKLNSYRQHRHKKIKGAVRMVLKFLKFCKLKDGTLLDVGCGSGWFRRYATGIDYIGLEVLIRKDVTIDFPMVVGLGERLPFKEASFDHVLIYATLDHVFDPIQVLKESFRVLKKGGGVYILNAVKMQNGLRKIFVYGFLLFQKIVYFDYESIIRNTKKAILGRPDEYHTFEFSTNDINDMLKKAGYLNISSSNYFNTSFFRAKKPLEITG